MADGRAAPVLFAEGFVLNQEPSHFAILGNGMWIACKHRHRPADCPC